MTKPTLTAASQEIEKYEGAHSIPLRAGQSFNLPAGGVRPQVTRRPWHSYVELAALALLLGPIGGLVDTAAKDALASHELAVEALASFIAGLLLTFGFGGSSRRPVEPAASRAVWLLIVPHFVSVLTAVHLASVFSSFDLPWGAATALGFAAPLWLVLLAGAGVAEIQVPRAVAAAPLIGLASILFAVPENVYAISPAQIPALLFHAALNMFTVFTWVWAAPRLGEMRASSAAGRFLLLRTAIDGLLSLTLERTSYHAVLWREALLWLTLAAAITGTASFLWFRLLETMPLPAFTLYPLSIWTAQLAGGLLVFRSFRWQMDLAAAGALAALYFGLRARPPNDDPIALQLR